ncbi:DNA-directed RNA polymerase I subunit A12 [Saitoella complicata NRRL Y-17804]|uniref:DNA-directed RNA polymerase I subunit A12 n=1 Tax=Saitoella complicata (strain BCRC 22490 / CBS 7301 / JCM 7358 / NBRC 10748 / NRRL Y-17804) TaxID=698492 RepID=UPI0008677AB2|nr:DNA-directed RNA polymerase I subunit A12 [Saitoella complicata NRRL Y-17804]ODQ53956.1 DNA-directed RNA polymerase I subunit A12 [Saitoella complicata NRRL Y-17804]
MSIVGGLIFCQDCGNLLDSSSSDAFIVCNQCGASLSTSALSNLEVRTHSSPTAFPSALRQKQSLVQGLQTQEQEEAAVIEEKCPNCGNEEMTFHTLQLRSADEGATVFYNCPRCAYKFSTNN